MEMFHSAFPTLFVGRHYELSYIAQRLADPGCRLLTLLGPGGIGKTRLAWEVARDQQEVLRMGRSSSRYSH